MMPHNEYVEIRNGGYYVAGSRIGLDIIYHEFQDGISPEEMLHSYPSMGSLAKVYGAIAFMLDHPDAVQEYLRDQDRLFEEIKAKYPLSAVEQERFERISRELAAKRR